MNCNVFAFLYFKLNKCLFVVRLASGLDQGVQLYVGQFICSYYFNSFSEGVTTTKKHISQQDCSWLWGETGTRNNQNITMIVNRYTAICRACLFHHHVPDDVLMSNLFNLELYLSRIFYFSICFLTSYLHKQDKFYATVLYLRIQLLYSSPNRHSLSWLLVFIVVAQTVRQ